jgi:hypothetical protein
MRHMNTLIPWLPPLVLLDSFGGNWEKYLEVIYIWFRQDFIASQPSFRGVKLALKRHPVYEGKEATFWHIISEGDEEGNRLPDIRRCERIRWPRPIIENSTEVVIKVWENERGQEKRVCLWLESCEYLVVLAVRSGYILLWTAYPVTRGHQKRKLEKEYLAFKKANVA